MRGIHLAQIRANRAPSILKVSQMRSAGPCKSLLLGYIVLANSSANEPNMNQMQAKRLS